jgi:hypothetical protein
MRFEYNNFTPSDIEVIARQIRSDAISICSVAERCAYGYPRIIVLSPVKGDSSARSINHESLANVLWLTCPYCNDIIHRLEDRGYVTKISQFLYNLRMAREKMQTAHSHIYFVRKKLYKDFFDDTYPEELIGLFNTGIGGVRDGHSLKCLHANFAFYRMDNTNCAGYIVQKLMGDTIDCGNNWCGNEDL